MDTYDEVHDIKNSRDIDTPPDLDVSSAIKFVNHEEEESETNEVVKNFKGFTFFI